MRKITCILLAVTFVLYLGGVQVMYWIKISLCKEQVQALLHGHKLSRRNTVDFSFTASEYNSLDWSEQNKEFTYNGERYDIVEMQYFSDEITVKCYSDNAETELIDAFSGFIKKMFSSPQPSNNSNTDISGNIYKEYLPSEFTAPSYFARVLISIKATCVLVNVSAKIDDIWHPPTLA